MPLRLAEKEPKFLTKMTLPNLLQMLHSAKSPANVTANQNDTTHPNKERASRTKPRIKLNNAEMTIVPVMTISIQIISRAYFANK
jgi:hypothetical protein